MINVTELPFSLDQLQRIENNLLEFLDKGEPKDYDVRIDGLKVIPRTSDPEPFSDILDHIDQKTRLVCVRLFTGRSKHYDQIDLVVEANMPKKADQLTLEGIESRWNEKLANERLRWDHDFLKREKEKLEKELEGKKATVKELEDEVEKYKKRARMLEGVGLKDLIGLATGKRAGGGAGLAAPPAEAAPGDYQIIESGPLSEALAELEEGHRKLVEEISMALAKEPDLLPDVLAITRKVSG